PARRSASAGRDKRSELRARYWALLFGDLQRAIGEIYNTVEAHENLNECQEVILVLENYTRDFKALGEWFRLKWEYDNTPPPQRPQSLAWEIRKTDFVRPESRRTHSVKSSPSVSGKNSPCLSGHNTPSGKNSPNLTGKASPGSGKISPRISSGHSSTSPKANIEFFSSKIAASKVTAKPEPNLTKESSRLSDITEKEIKENHDSKKAEKDEGKPVTNVTAVVEIGKAKECPNASPKQVVIKSPKRALTNQESPVNSAKGSRKSSVESSSQINQAREITAKLEAMENEFLAKQLIENKIKNDNMLNHDKETEKPNEDVISNNIETIKLDSNLTIDAEEKLMMVDNKSVSSSESPTKSEDNFGDISNESSTKSLDAKTPDIPENIEKLSQILESDNVEETTESNDTDTSESVAKVSNTDEASDAKMIVEVQETADENGVEMPNKVEKNSDVNNAEITPKVEKSTKTNDAEKKLKKVLETDEVSEAGVTVSVEKSAKSNDAEVVVKGKANTVNDTEVTVKTEKTVEAKNSKVTVKIEEIAKVNNAEVNIKVKEGNSKKKSDLTNAIPEKSNLITENKIENTKGDVSKDLPHIADNDKAPKDSTINKLEPNETDKLSKTPEQNGALDGKEEPRKEADKSSETKMNTRPAYSQAAAKPKPVTVPKTEVKTPTKTTTLVRSKTVVEIRPVAPKPQRPQFPKKNQVNKCSYPFNLTTGRKSLFDSPTATNKNALPKKPLNKNVQLASGDNKSSQNKIDTKKRPPRPTSLKVDDRDTKKDKNNPTLEKIKDCDEYGSSDTIVTQIDMTRIESSESLKTLVPDEMLMIDDVGNSIEVLNVDNNKSDNEGWLTVKSRRLSRESKKQSKSHWAQRFHQPSATTSLPTLNMIESPKQETKPIVDSPKNAKLDRAKSEQPQVVIKPEKVVKVAVTVTPEAKIKDPAMIRQKSDVTGLKSKSSRSKALTKKVEKSKDEKTHDDETSDLTKNRLHSSLESLTTGLARSQESTEEAFDFDKWRSEFRSTFKYFDDDDQILNHTDILESADPSERSEIAEMTSQIEENEKKLGWALDFQAEVDQRKLCEEEDLLNRQILELQQVSDIDLDTETDDTETDAEILCEDTTCHVDEVTGRLVASLEDRYETALAGMSWAERVDTLGALEALVARDPGRAQQLHAKLSQGIKRRGSLQDALRRLQAKQARAERQRLEYQTERAKKIHQLLARVEEVKVAKNQLIEEKRLRMEKRLQKATENRDQHLKDIVRKAHDEEEKLREIAFIKQLEAENRRHDFLDQCRSHTTRLRQMRRERLTKLEQKAAREAAVGARREALEAARRRRVEALVERRKLRDARRDTLDQLKRHERHRLAKEKAEGVKSRLSALAAAAELEADALRSRIRDKQDASQQRLESHLQAIREKATTGPRQATTSESQDQSTKEERELAEQAERLEQERKEREKQKAIKKKARKVKQKLLASGNVNDIFTDHTIVPFEPLYPTTGKLHKTIHTLTNIINPLLDSIERSDYQNGLEEKKKRKKKKESPEPENRSEAENNNNTEVVPPECSNGGKKKRKNKEPKLSKANSVCSSLSDMSRASNKSERKANIVIDVPMLERQLNELNRLMEKFDRNSSDKIVFQKIHGLKLLGQLLAVAAEREELASQLTAKLLATAVTVVSRVVGGCAVSAAYLLTTNTTVHLVTLLSEQLEKNMNDYRELELAKQLCDCLSVALDSVLCSTRVYEETKEEGKTGQELVSHCAAMNKAHTIIRVDEESKEADKEEIDLLVTLRTRAHTLISYICLCGCITKAEKAGEARESIQTLLTVCADLCHPCDVDVGSERISATQSLRCALGTGMCGSRAEFCVLFARGAQIGGDGSGGFVRAARTAHLLRALAELDHHIVQVSKIDLLFLGPGPLHS
ncbi:227 kDa spindle- and centromere-associated protein, partial [Ostrinia nubilalis]|uniref:227 kDa spindle- and centromere-associated protein n=1 Tax=Ostrinia nubilalis TaxID=29057 RepID=UPI0030825960